MFTDSAWQKHAALAPVYSRRAIPAVPPCWQPRVKRGWRLRPSAESCWCPAAWPRRWWRWICENIDGYQMTGTLVEKYNLVRGGSGGGGEYAIQVGFGWTNGVLRAFASLFPKLSSLNPQLCEASRTGRQ
jgi:hypothetical protein